MTIVLEQVGFGKIRRGPETSPAEIPTTANPKHHLSPTFPRNPHPFRSKDGSKAFPQKQTPSSAADLDLSGLGAIDFNPEVKKQLK